MNNKDIHLSSRKILSGYRCMSEIGKQWDALRGKFKQDFLDNSNELINVFYLNTCHVMDDNGMIYRKSLDNYGIYVRKNGKKRGKLPDVYVGVFICIAPEEVAEDDNFLPYFAIACRPRSYGDYPIYDEEFHKISNENYRIEQKYEENKYKDNLYYRWYDSNETHFQNEIQTWNSITYIHPLIEINSENDIKDLIDKALWMSQQVINIYPT